MDIHVGSFLIKGRREVFQSSGHSPGLVRDSQLAIPKGESGHIRDNTQPVPDSRADRPEQGQHDTDSL